MPTQNDREVDVIFLAYYRKTKKIYDSFMLNADRNKNMVHAFEKNRVVWVSNY